MKAILYVSKVNREFTASDLSLLLVKARERNLTLGVTGYLYYHAPHFFQYIESAGDEADELMQSINADERHEVLHTLEETFTGERRFADWSMNFVSHQVVLGLTLEELVLDDLLALNGVYTDKSMWQETLFSRMSTIAQNNRKLTG